MGLKIGKWEPGKSASNLFKNPVKEVKNALIDNNAYVRNARFLYGMAAGKAPKAPEAGEDPNVTALRNRLFGESEQFNQDLPGMKERAGNLIQAEGDQALQSGLRGTQQNFNRRGLLYSGMRQGAEQGVRGKVASEISSQRAQSNMDLDKLGTAKAAKAASVGLQSYQNQVQREADIAGINLQNQVARAQAMQQLGQIGGYIAGSMYSRQPGAAQPQSGGINSAYTPNFSNDYRNGNLRADSDYSQGVGF
jgi:hypothetical protein